MKFLSDVFTSLLKGFAFIVYAFMVVQFILIPIIMASLVVIPLALLFTNINFTAWVICGIILAIVFAFSYLMENGLAKLLNAVWPFFFSATIISSLHYFFTGISWGMLAICYAGILLATYIVYGICKQK